MDFTGLKPRAIASKVIFSMMYYHLQINYTLSFNEYVITCRADVTSYTTVTGAFVVSGSFRKLCIFIAEEVALEMSANITGRCAFLFASDGRKRALWLLYRADIHLPVIPA
jgi:hypothetical protein